jgi:NitT/TauT family transport system ATP-binding protein
MNENLAEKAVKLSLQNISHSYTDTSGQSMEAINNISLNIKDGEFVAIVGSSGCGKSTLLNIMCGILEPSQGSVLLDGHALRNAKSKIGYISQMDTLLPWRRVIKNVALGLEIEGKSKKERLQIAKELIETSGLSGFEDKYPFELSGGMRKRVIIIRALAQNPDVIFMDEPFGPLDIFTKTMLQQEILKIWSEHKNTIIYITHDIAEAIVLADRIILLSYRPATIKAEYKVELPRPRIIEECKYNPYFLELEKEIWDTIKEDVKIAQQEEFYNNAKKNI